MIEWYWHSWKRRPFVETRGEHATVPGPFGIKHWSWAIKFGPIEVKRRVKA